MFAGASNVRDISQRGPATPDHILRTKRLPLLGRAVTEYAAAYREYAEEIGVAPPDGDPLPLGEITQRSGKRVVAWAVERHLDIATVKSNLFSM